MFSEKYVNNGIAILQQNDVDKRLKIDIWNSIQVFYLDNVYSYRSGTSIPNPYSWDYLYECKNSTIIIDLYSNFFIEPVNNLSSEHLSTIKKEIENLYNRLKWYEIYNLIEFVSLKVNNDKFVRDINYKLERNNSAYRLINKDICPITNDIEIAEITNATNTIYDSVNGHIQKAIQLFGDRNNPDYENTIKESITAVETMCSLIVGKQAMLSDAIKKLEKNGVIIHPVLKDSFAKLYAYTSDANGIRHAGNIGGKNSTFAEAKFMLVSCSAFVNYLIENFQNRTN